MPLLDTVRSVVTEAENWFQHLPEPVKQQAQESINTLKSDAEVEANKVVEAEVASLNLNPMEKQLLDQAILFVEQAIKNEASAKLSAITSLRSKAGIASPPAAG